MPSRRPRSATRSRGHGKGAADRFQDGAAGEHQIGALGADAGAGDALLVAHGQQARRSPRLISSRAHPAAVDAAAVVALEIEMHAGDRRHGAGGAEQMDAAQAVAAMLARERREQCARPPRPSPRRFRASTSMPPWRSASVTTPCGSEIQPRICGSGGPRAHRLRAVEPHELGRAAADVEQHDAVAPAGSISGVQPVAASSRFGLAVDRFRARGRACSATRARNSSPFSAARQASVAISRARVTPLLLHLVAADRRARRARARSPPRSGARRR